MTPKHLDNIYFRTTDLHSAFEGKRVFIAGNGFYATWFKALFEDLKNRRNINVECVALSRRDNWKIECPESYGHSNLKADFVINCVGNDVGVNGIDMLYTHGLGPIWLFQHLPIGAKGLQISTGAINSDTPYAQAKRVAELGIGLLGRDVQIVRPFATVGPGMNLNAHFAISNFISRHLKGEHLEVTSQPCYRSFVHIVDLMVQMLHVLINGDGKPYQVGSDNVINMSDAAKAISSNVKVVDTIFPSSSNSEFYVTNLERIRRQFNLELDFSSEEGILDTLHFYQKNDAPLLSPVS